MSIIFSFKMARIGAFVCLVIVVMDIVAGILSIEAQISRNKVIRSLKCKEESGDAFSLGLAAGTLLAAAHIAANLLGGFICICYPERLENLSNNKQYIWFACLSLSWIVAAVGFPMLIMGTLEISKSRGSCSILHNHVLFVCGILCFAHGLFCIAFYVFAMTGSGNESVNEQEARP